MVATIDHINALYEDENEMQRDISHSNYGVSV